MENPQELRIPVPIEESRIFKKTSQFLLEIGITNYSYESLQDGSVQFVIVLPEEHVQNIKDQMKSLGGYIDSTDFVKSRIIPLKQKIIAVKDLNCEVSQDLGNNKMKIRVYKDKWKKASRI